MRDCQKIVIKFALSQALDAEYVGHAVIEHEKEMLAETSGQILTLRIAAFMTCLQLECSH